MRRCRGVVRLHHPHGIRSQVIEALEAEMPEVLDALFAAGRSAWRCPAAG